MTIIRFTVDALRSNIAAELWNPVVYCSYTKYQMSSSRHKETRCCHCIDTVSSSVVIGWGIYNVHERQINFWRRQHTVAQETRLQICNWHMSTWRLGVISRELKLPVNDASFCSRSSSHGGDRMPLNTKESLHSCYIFSYHNHPQIFWTAWLKIYASIEYKLFSLTQEVLTTSLPTQPDLCSVYM